MQYRDQAIEKLRTQEGLTDKSVLELQQVLCVSYLLFINFLDSPRKAKILRARAIEQPTIRSEDIVS